MAPVHGHPRLGAVLDVQQVEKLILLGNGQASASSSRERKPLEGTEAIRVEPARLAVLARLGDGQCRLPVIEGLVGRPQLGRQSGKLRDAATDTASTVTSATLLTRERRNCASRLGFGRLDHVGAHGIVVHGIVVAHLSFYRSTATTERRSGATRRRSR